MRDWSSGWLSRLRLWTYRTVQAERQEHHKKDERPENGSGHGGDGRGVDDEDQAGTLRGHVADVPPRDLGHVTQHREDNEPRHEARRRVDERRQKGVPKTKSNGIKRLRK